MTHGLFDTYDWDEETHYECEDQDWEYEPVLPYEISNMIMARENRQKFTDKWISEIMWTFRVYGRLVE